MNKVFLNTVMLNSTALDLVGNLTRKKEGGGSGEGGDTEIPSGYEEFITADDMVFSASRGAFYVKL